MNFYWPHLHPRLKRNDTVYYIDNGPTDTGRVITATRRNALVVFDDDPEGYDAGWFACAQLMLI